MICPLKIIPQFPRPFFHTSPDTGASQTSVSRPLVTGTTYPGALRLLFDICPLEFHKRHLEIPTGSIQRCRIPRSQVHFNNAYLALSISSSLMPFRDQTFAFAFA
jgi:hypothetical protein